MYNIRENILHGIEQYETEAVIAEATGNPERVATCNAVVAVLKETLADPLIDEDDKNNE